MTMDQRYTALFDELEKLAVSSEVSPFMQSRKGRRPIRVAKLIALERHRNSPADEETTGAFEHEMGSGMMDDKLGEDRTLKERAMHGFVRARPYAAAAAQSGIPAALAGKFLFEGGSGRLAGHAARTFGLIGAGAGITNEALKQWAIKNRRRKEAKQILGKTAAMAADLRTRGIGGVVRPPMPTEDSKQESFRRLTNSQKPGMFLNTTKPRHLRAPGPSIPQVAPVPR